MWRLQDPTGRFKSNYSGLILLVGHDHDPTIGPIDWMNLISFDSSNRGTTDEYSLDPTYNCCCKRRKLHGPVHYAAGAAAEAEIKCIAISNISSKFSHIHLNCDN